jgi:hypothetical protein
MFCWHVGYYDWCCLTENYIRKVPLYYFYRYNFIKCRAGIHIIHTWRYNYKIWYISRKPSICIKQYLCYCIKNSSQFSLHGLQ